jgi:segregation and condensation protein A
MTIAIKLQTFEAPRDLLLHLIDQAEVDIYDIPIAEITDQYLSYIYSLQEFKLDIASEFLVMAATLLAIKSKMLLPRYEPESLDPLHDWEEEEDPREELVQRLIEYKKYKIVSEILKEKEFARNQVFTRPAEDLSQYLGPEHKFPANLNLSVLQLYIAFQTLWLKRKEEKTISTIPKEEISVSDKINEILFRLANSHGPILFTDLIRNYHTRSEMVVTFLAILELIKQRAIKIHQPNRFGDIEIVGNSG